MGLTFEERKLIKQAISDYRKANPILEIKPYTGKIVLKPLNTEFEQIIRTPPKKKSGKHPPYEERKLKPGYREKQHEYEKNYRLRKNRKGGFIIPDDCSTVTCPDCLKVSAYHDSWRHWDDCPGVLPGRRSPRPQRTMRMR